MLSSVTKFSVCAILAALIVGSLASQSPGEKSPPEAKARSNSDSSDYAKARRNPDSPDCEVTLDGFYSLATNDSYQAARRKLGCSGELAAKTDMLGYNTVMVTWRGNSWAGNMNATFQNNKLISKAQFGLK
ncbi:hypothetical protein [Rhizobium sp. LCM 4573]|uniref:hypothetical protein n=1 Tax=Rhizobium sp. LCM 4573 TaxID=1848291 RepID=UPI0012FF8712|nr:hypothetical protein [Rhizobium sp. LCM 4573]